MSPLQLQQLYQLQQFQITLFGEEVKVHKFPKTQYLGSKERLVK